MAREFYPSVEAMLAPAAFSGLEGRPALGAAKSESEAIRTRERAELEWWSACVRRAMRRL